MMLALLAAVATAAAPQPCTASQLKLVYKGFDGAAGTRYELFRLVPRRGISCRLGGNPGIAFLDSRGRKVVHVGRYHDDLHPARTLTFSGRRPARFDVRHPDMNRRTGQPCRRRIVSVRVIPPNQTSFLALNFHQPLRLCPSGAHVSPVGRRY